MGLIHAAETIIFIMLISVIVSLVLSLDLYSALYVGVVVIAIYGIVIGFIVAIKLGSHIERHVENNNKIAAKSLAKDINKAHKSIKIVGGTANPVVYNTTEVRTALENAIKKGVKVQVFFSEIDMDEKNVIIELAKNKKIELYTPNTDKVPINHFRVMDAISVYSEKEHTSKSEKRYSERFDNIYGIASRFEKAFDNIIANSKMVHP